LTSRVPEFQRAETRLARFIKALQEGDRVRAASLLSSRVPARDRAALLSGSWLRRRPGATLRRDFEQVLFTADLQIRTSAKMYRNQVHLSVMPRTLAIHEKPKQLGFLDVPMRKERGQWWVDLRRGRI
jgi:predicted nucleic acid-binding Zn ribbon protein